MSKLFNKIAPIYGMFFDFQVKQYQRVLDEIEKDFSFKEYDEIIDIGCGTGALCSVLAKKGLIVTGVDSAEKMLSIAVEKTKNDDIKFIKENVLDKLPFADNSFDISIASFVAHGLKACDRNLMYAEMERITKKYVIFYDYNDKHAILTNIVEFLEQGDYFNFIKVIKTELKEYFGNIKVINLDKRAALYICKINKNVMKESEENE